MHPDQTHHSTRTAGTVSHMAPEVLRAGKQSPAADVYAFGIVMWELATGRSPFANAHYGEVFERVAINGERPALEAALQQQLGEAFMVLMQACWATDPAMRPTFEQVCRALERLLAQQRSGEYMQHASGGAVTSMAEWLGLVPISAAAPSVVASAAASLVLGRNAGPAQEDLGPIDGFF